MKKLGLCILLSGLLISNNASAIELTHGSTRNALETSYIYMGENEGSGGHQFLGQYNGKNDLSFYNLPANKYVTTLHLDFSSVIQPNSIFTFTIYYRVKGGPWSYSVGIDYYGLSSGSAWTLLDESCTPGNEETLIATNTYEKTLTCTYVGFTNVKLDHIDTISNSYIVKLNNGGATAGWADGSGEIVVGYIDSRLISWNGLTDDDRAWLEEHMPAGSSTSDIEGAINNARDDEKSEYEEQQEGVDGSADDAGEEAEAATSNLIETTTSIINTIKDTPATNCNIRIKSGAFDTGNINLCNVPQEIRTVISTIITIPVTLAALHIAYSTVMLYLETVRKEQE